MSIKMHTKPATIIDRLTVFTREWREAAAADGLSLSQVKAPVGDVLEDMFDLLELTEDQRISIIGNSIQ